MALFFPPIFLIFSHSATSQFSLCTMFYCIPYIGRSQWYLFPKNKTYVGITYHIWKGRRGGGVRMPLKDTTRQDIKNSRSAPPLIYIYSNNLRPYIRFYGRIVYGSLRVMAVPSTVPYEMVPLASTVQYEVPYYGTRKPYIYGYGRQP